MFKQIFLELLTITFAFHHPESIIGQMPPNNEQACKVLQNFIVKYVGLASLGKISDATAEIICSLVLVL